MNEMCFFEMLKENGNKKIEEIIRKVNEMINQELATIKS